MTSGHTYQPPKPGGTMAERLAPLKAVADAADALMAFLDGEQVSPRLRALGRSEREEILRKALAAWKAQS